MTWDGCINSCTRHCARTRYRIQRVLFSSQQPFFVVERRAWISMLISTLRYRTRDVLWEYGYLTNYRLTTDVYWFEFFVTYAPYSLQTLNWSHPSCELNGHWYRGKNIPGAPKWQWRHLLRTAFTDGDARSLPSTDAEVESCERKHSKTRGSMSASDLWQKDETIFLISFAFKQATEVIHFLL